VNFSARIWQFCLAIAMILLLMTLTIDKTTAPHNAFNKVSFSGLQVKIETGLQQIYWQWQHQGRPDYIDYPLPGDIVERETIKIATNNQCLALVENSQQGCEEFISWFIDKKLLNKALQMSTTVVRETNELDEESFYCKLEYANRVFMYHPQTGDLRFLDEE